MVSLALDEALKTDADLLTDFGLTVGEIYLSCSIVLFCNFLFFGPGLLILIIVYFAVL